MSDAWSRRRRARHSRLVPLMLPASEAEAPAAEEKEEEEPAAEKAEDAEPAAEAEEAKADEPAAAAAAEEKEHGQEAADAKEPAAPVAKASTGGSSAAGDAPAAEGEAPKAKSSGLGLGAEVAVGAAVATGAAVAVAHHEGKEGAPAAAVPEAPKAQASSGSAATAAAHTEPATPEPAVKPEKLASALKLDDDTQSPASTLLTSKPIPVRQYLDQTVVPVLRQVRKCPSRLTHSGWRLPTGATCARTWPSALLSPSRASLRARCVLSAQGLRALVKARPDDPFEFLADYIRKNRPAEK